MAETERGNAASNEEESSVEMSNNNAIERGANLSEVVQTDDNRIKEKIAEIQGDATSHKETSCVEMSNNNSIKRGRGRPQGSMKLNKLKQVLSISTSESKPPRRGRGRPKLPKATELEGSGDDLAGNSVQTQEPNKQSSDEDGPTADRSPRKRGRPKKSLYKSTCDDAEDLPNGASDAPKAKRGRPKGSTKRKSGSLTSRENGGSSVQRQNPRRSSGKKPRLETEESSENGEDAERPKKIKQETAGSPPAKKRPGRPKGSLNKKRPAYKAKPWKRGRPRKPKAKRGRPRKYPLPSPEELKKPKVWKPLGRPRKYPRADPAEGSEPAPRRSRGRPHKTQSKKGAHLRKTLPESLSLPSDPGVEPQRKRGRPPSAPKSDAVPTRKRGRPKGSVNSSKAGRGAPIDSADDDHSTAESDSAPMVLKCEEEEAEIKEDASINQDADSEVKPPTEVIQTDGNCKEEEQKMAETEQGDAASHEEESSVEESNNSPVKSGRVRPHGFKMLKVSLTDITKTEQVSGIFTSESKPPRRGRGRPKLPKATELEGSEDDLAANSVQTQEPNKQSSDEDGPTADRSPRKRGRPKKSLYKSTCDDAEDLPNGASDAPKAKRGRPKGSTKRKSGSLTSRENGGSSVQRQNPRRSPDNKPRLETEESSEDGEDAESPPRGRGRPKKIKQETDGSPPAKKRPGRPKGSLNKKQGQRGRPRKYPEELKKPKVWKPLGRPRKYPRADPAEGSEPAPPRSRGRPHKSESKRGAHLRKSLSESSPSPSDPGVEPQRKRGRPPSAPKSDAVPTRKRGRPKGSVNSSKAGRGAPIDSADADHSTAESDSAPVALKCEEEEAEIKKDASINQDADSEVSNQA